MSGGVVASSGEPQGRWRRTRPGTRQFLLGALLASLQIAAVDAVPEPPPDPPVAKSATSIERTRFTANWQPTAGAAGYRLDVSPGEAFSAFIPGFEDLDVGNITSSVVDVGLSSGTQYFFRVRAYHAGGTSDNSNVVSVTTVPEAPVAAPASNVAQTVFVANWGPSPGAAGYRLDVAIDSEFTTCVAGFQDLDVGNVAAFSVGTNIQPDSPYFYRVRAYTTGGTSEGSDVISVVTPPEPPAAPLAAEATDVSAIGFVANWRAAAGAEGYRLDVSIDGAFTAFVPGYQNLDVGSVTTYTVTGLAPETAYFYRVRAYNRGGVSVDSNPASATTQGLAPGPAN